MPFIARSPFHTFYRIQGSTGPPLIFIHGAWLDHQMWRKQLDFFSRQFRVVAYDLKGHGQHLDPPPHQYSIALWSDELTYLVNELFPDQQVIICGLSLGGMIAIHWAHHHRERIAGLIVVDSTIDFRMPSGSLPFYKAVHSLVYWALSVLPFEWVIRAFFHGLHPLLSRGQRPSRGAFIKYIESCLRRMGKQRWLAVFNAASTYAGLQEYQIPSRTIFIKGSHDFWFVRRRMRRWAEKLNIPCVTIPRAAHMPNIENTTIFHQALTTFLNPMAG